MGVKRVVIIEVRLAMVEAKRTPFLFLHHSSLGIVSSFGLYYSMTIRRSIFRWIMETLILTEMEHGL